MQMDDEDGVVVLSFPVAQGLDLRAILDILGRTEAGRLHWVVDGLECSGGSAFVREFADDLDRAPDRQSVVEGARLLQYADEVGQTIDGHFAGFRSAGLAQMHLGGLALRPLARWVIDCIDSSVWEVQVSGQRQADLLLDALPGGRAIPAPGAVDAPSEAPQATDRYLPLGELRLHDAVRAAAAREEPGIPAGALGTIVMLHDDGACEVEFVREDGSTLGTCTMQRDELRANRVHPDPSG
jgi:hypothetical protein